VSQGTIPGRAGDTALATFEFRRGELRGSHLALFATRLEHRAGDFFEVMPLDRLGALRAGFERDAGRLQWGGILLFVAVLVIGSYWPLRSLVAMGFAEVNTQSQGGGAFLPAALEALDFCVGLLPLAGAVLGLRGLSRLVPAWMGNTVLTVSTGALERTFASRGRDPELLEFSETVAERLGAGAGR
jgi:hypothetical protein